jgi:quinol monooxygenase YgiN
MIVSMMKLNVSPDNRKELLQTISSLNQSTRQEKGCLDHHVYQDVENANILFFKEEWETLWDLENHLRSYRFSVLLGAMRLLVEPPEFEFNEVKATSGIEVIRAAREKVYK